MSERIRFIARLEEGESVAELAREFGISTKTAFKFWGRWKREGVLGLEDRSHAVDRIPHRTPDEIVALMIALRNEHPNWGARILKTRLETLYPGVRIPSAGTVHAWIKKHGLTRARKQRMRTPPSVSTLRRSETPNDIWATDFKGQFRLGNSKLCYPLTVTDLFSRYIVGCEALEGTKADPVWDVFEMLFSEFGIPSAIRSDNGTPFASTGLAGLTNLSVKWLRLGIRLERIEPGHPEQNGQHERMHRTLKEETTRPAGSNLIQQQERFDSFVEEFNQIRPHRALDMKCPATAYQPSPRRYDGLPTLQYPLADDVLTVGKTGSIRISNRSKCQLTQALVGAKVGIREVDDRRWLVSYACLDLGVFDERDNSFVTMDVQRKSNKPSPISPN